MSAAVKQEQDDHTHGDDSESDHRERGQEDCQHRHQDDDELGDRGDPGGLSHNGVRVAAPRRDIGREGDYCEREHRPPRDRVEEDEDAFDQDDPEDEVHAASPQNLAEPSLPVFDRSEAAHTATVSRPESAVPDGDRQPCSTSGGEGAPSSQGRAAMVEQAVHRRAGTGDIGPEGSESAEFVG